MKAENFEPEYMKINPNGTVPSLVVTAHNKPLIDTRSILEYLDQSSPNSTRTPALTPTDPEIKIRANALIELVHSSDLDTNLILLACRDEAELEEKRSGVFGSFVAARQAVLKKYHQIDPSNALYAAKVKENGALSHIYTTGPSDERKAFFVDTQKRYVKFASTMEELNSRIRLPYATGDEVVLADLHIVPWLSHALAGVGTVDPSDFSKLEAHIGKTVPGFKVGDNVRAWWSNFGKRDSFKKVFHTLH